LLPEAVRSQLDLVLHPSAGPFVSLVEAASIAAS
jgi:hypothetical protein